MQNFDVVERLLNRIL